MDNQKYTTSLMQNFDRVHDFNTDTHKEMESSRKMMHQRNCETSTLIYQFFWSKSATISKFSIEFIYDILPKNIYSAESHSKDT